MAFRSIDIQYWEDQYGELSDVLMSIDDFQFIIEEALRNNDQFFLTLAHNIDKSKKDFNKKTSILN